MQPGKLALGSLVACVMALGAPAASAAVALAPNIVRSLADCPAHRTERGWPYAADVKRWALGRTVLYVVRCETAGDDEYYAAVTQTRGRVHRHRFPAFEHGRFVADVIDREARRQRRLGQLHWDPRRRRLIGETSVGCAASTEYAYRWTSSDFVLSWQRHGQGCGARRWRTDYREPPTQRRRP